MRKPKYKRHQWEQEVTPEYLEASRQLSWGDRREFRRRQRQSAEWARRSKVRTAELRRGARVGNGDKWGNSWLKRRRFLENKIEQSERKVRAWRMLHGATLYNAPWGEQLAAVRCVTWRYALRYLAQAMLRGWRDTYTKLPRVGEDDL